MATEDATCTWFIMENPGWFEWRGRGWRGGRCSKTAGGACYVDGSKPTFYSCHSILRRSLVNHHCPWKHLVQNNSILGSADESQGHTSCFPSFYFIAARDSYLTATFYFLGKFLEKPFSRYTPLISSLEIIFFGNKNRKLQTNIGSLSVSQPAICGDHFPTHCPLYCEFEIVHLLFFLQGKNIKWGWQEGDRSH